MQQNLYGPLRFISRALALALIFSASSAYSTSINDAIRQAIETNPDVLNAQAERDAAKSDVRQVVGEYLPSLDVEGGIGREVSDNPATRATPGRHRRTLTRQESRVFARQLIFDGWNVSSRIKQSKFTYQAASFQVLEAKEQFAFEGAAAYLDVMRNRELVRVRRLDVKAHVETLAKVSKRLKAGAGRKSELNLAKSRLALSRADLERALGNLKDSKATYFDVVGVEAPSDMQKPHTPPTVPHSKQEAIDVALNINPSLGSAKSEVGASIAAIDEAKSPFYPTITFEVTGTMNNDLDGVKGHNNDLQGLFRLTYNVFRGGSDWAGVDSAQSRKIAAKHDAESIRTGVIEDVSISWNNLKAAKNRIPYLQTHRHESRNVFDAYRKQFQLGQRTLFDLLNAQTELYDAMTNLVNGIYDEITANYRLLAGMGKLVESINLDGLQRDTHLNISYLENYDNITLLPMEADTGAEVEEIIKEKVKHSKEPSHINRSVDYYDHDVSIPSARRVNTNYTHQRSEFDKNLMKIPSNHYTIQLMTSKYPGNLERLIQEQGLQKDTTYYAVKVGGQTFYRLIHGDYHDKVSAKEAIKDLPKDLVAKLSPVTRSFASVKSSMRVT